MADNLKSPKVLSALALVLAGGVTGGAFAQSPDAATLDQQLSVATSIDLANDAASAGAGAVAQLGVDPHHVDEIHHHHSEANLAAREGDAVGGADDAVFKV